MSTEAEFRVYAEQEIGRTLNKRYKTVMVSEEFDPGGPIFPAFLRGYSPDKKWDPYSEEEITEEEIRTFVERCKEAVRLQEEVLGKDKCFMNLDLNIKEHKELFDAVCDLICATERVRDYLSNMLYKLDHIKDDLGVFENILRCVHAHRQTGSDPYITVQYD